VKVFIKIGVLALAALFAALPVMACAVPNVAMTAAERACCKKMAEQCGLAGTGMAKSHPCCQSTATPADFQALKTASSLANHFGFILVDALPAGSHADSHCYLAQLSSQNSCTQSPPGLESTSTTILRI